MKKEKQMLLDDVQGQIQRSSTFLIAGYQGFSGLRAYEFRRELGKRGVYFEVLRKRMLVRAAKNLGMEFDLGLLPGHVGLILGDSDPAETAKCVLKFSEENERSLELLGGFIEGQKASAEDVRRLATLPGKDQMRAEFLGLLDAPAAQLLTVLEAPLSGIVYCMKNFDIK